MKNKKVLRKDHRVLIGNKIKDKLQQTKITLLLRRIILSFHWVKYLKWKNPSMMKRVGGPRSLPSQIWVEPRPPTQWSLNRKRTYSQRSSWTPIQIKTRARWAIHPNSSTKRRRKNSFSTPKVRVEPHSIGQTTSHPFWQVKRTSLIITFRTKSIQVRLRRVTNHRVLRL